MKYAIIELQGHQFWVQEGTYFITNKIFSKANECIQLNKILLIKDNKEYFLGNPYSRISSVYCLIKNHFKGIKISIVKMKSKAKYRKKYGHRQILTKLLVVYIHKYNS